MLFDTSSPGRRRAVQITFGFLAVLMSAGLILFGIGSSSSQGGLVDGLQGDGTTNVSKDAKKLVEKSNEALIANPKDLTAANNLAKARFTLVQQDAYDANGKLKDGGDTLITNADNAWTKYIGLAPVKPDASTASNYVVFYETVGKYDKAAKALEAVLVTRKASAGLLAQLAEYYYYSSNPDKGDEAAARAEALAESPARKKAITTQVTAWKADVKKQEAAIAKQQAAASKGSDSTGATSTTPTLPTLPTLSQ
jgi:tetratricopeptide (TPR) repeat protein